MTITPPEPDIEPAAATASKASPTSSWSGISTGIDEPPGTKHFSERPSGMPPPQPSMRSRNVAVSGSS